MPYNTDQVLMALWKRKIGKGLSGSPQKKKQEVEPRASTFPPRVPVVDFDAPRTSRAIVK